MKKTEWLRLTAMSEEEVVSELNSLLDGLDEADMAGLQKYARNSNMITTITKCPSKDCGIKLRVSKFANSHRCPSCSNLFKTAAEEAYEQSLGGENVWDEEVEEEGVSPDKSLMVLDNENEEAPSAAKKWAKIMALIGILLGAGSASFLSFKENPKEAVKQPEIREVLKQKAPKVIEILEETYKPGDTPTNNEDALKRYKMNLRHRMRSGGGGINGLIPAGHQYEQDPERWINQLTEADLPDSHKTTNPASKSERRKR